MGTKLADLLAVRACSVRKLAAASGIPERTVYRHVRGDAVPNVKQALQYARVLSCAIDELVEEGEEA